MGVFEESTGVDAILMAMRHTESSGGSVIRNVNSNNIKRIPAFRLYVHASSLGVSMLRTIEKYMEDRRLLASAALFRQLHENKKDVYDVLAQFIRSSISWSSSWSFNVTECSDILERYFGFKIPDAVIRTCLKKRLKRAGELSLSQGVYVTTATFVRADSLKEDYTNIQSEQRYIIDTLTEYVEKVTTGGLNESERHQLSADFHSYFLGGLKPCANSLLISEFIVKYSSSAEFTEKLNRVEEGLILYGGICHSSSLANHEPWRNNFTIYLDTEVLFFHRASMVLYIKVFLMIFMH